MPETLPMWAIVVLDLITGASSAVMSFVVVSILAENELMELFAPHKDLIPYMALFLGTLIFLVLLYVDRKNFVRLQMEKELEIKK